MGVRSGKNIEHVVISRANVFKKDVVFCEFANYHQKRMFSIT